MKEKLQKILGRLAAIDGLIAVLLAADETSAEQLAEHDRLVAERGKLEAQIQPLRDQITREEKRLQMEAEEQERTRAAEVAAERARRSAAPGRTTDFDQTTTNDPGSLVPKPPAAGTVPAAYRRYGRLKAFKGDRDGRSAEERAYRFGMLCLAELGQQHPGRFGRNEACIQAQRWVTANMADITGAGRSQMVVTTTDASGYQFLIPPEFSPDIIDLREKFGVVRKLFKIEPMTSDRKIIPRRVSGLTAVWTSEGGVIPASNKVFNDVELIAKDLTALSVATSQVNADTIISWGDDLAREIAYAFSQAEDQAGFNGDGSSTFGRVVGVRTKLVNCDGAGTASAGLVTGTGAGWGGLTMIDFENVVGTLPEFADSPECCWVTHRKFFFQKMRSLELALGGVSAMEASEGVEEVMLRPLFLGYPVQFSQVFPASSASAQVPVAFGDFNLGASFGDRQQEAIAFSDQGVVGGVSLFERNLLGIRGTERLDINVHDAGTATVVGPIVGLLTG